MSSSMKKAEGVEDEAAETSALLGKAAPAPPVHSAYDRLFLRHINESFGDHLELALRGALFTVVFGAP